MNTDKFIERIELEFDKKVDKWFAKEGSDEYVIIFEGGSQTTIPGTKVWEWEQQK